VAGGMSKPMGTATLIIFRHILENGNLNPLVRVSRMCFPIKYDLGLRVGYTEAVKNSVRTPIQWVPRVLSRVVKWPGHHSPESSAEVKNGGAIPLLLHTPSWRGS
jgi:hypothetical protein